MGLLPEDQRAGLTLPRRDDAARTSSARPANLLAYRDAGLEQVVRWESLVTTVGEALEALRTALADVDLPASCDINVPALEARFHTLTANQRHLDDWVGDVGDEFVRITGGGEPSADIVTVRDSQIHVGFANRQDSERQAREDAALIQEIIGETGLFSPYDDPDQLEELAEQYPELRDLFERSRRFLDDEDYAAVLINELGAQDVRTLVDLATTFGTAEHRGIIEDDTYTGYLLPMAALVSAADRSGRMSQEVHDVLVDPSTADDPVWGDDQGHGVGLSVTADRLRANALLLHAGDFPPYTTAELANGIMDTLHDGAYGASPADFEHRGAAYSEHAELLQEHPELSSMEWIALDALAEDPQASYIFWSMDERAEPPLSGNLSYMEDLSGNDRIAAARLAVAGVEFEGSVDHQIEMARRDALQGGLLDFPATQAGQDDGTYGTDTLDLISDAFAHAGYHDVDLSNPVRHAFAEVSTPYTVDIAVAGDGYELSDPAGHRQLDQEIGGDDDRFILELTPGQVDGFMQEVAQGGTAREVLARNGAALVQYMVDQAAPHVIAGDTSPLAEAESVITSYYSELGDAWREVGDDPIEQHRQLIQGMQSITDPVLHIVSGGLVDHVGPVNAVTDAPVVTDVYGAVQDEAESRLSGRIYELLFPAPGERETMGTWAEREVRDALRASITNAVYTNEDLRNHLIVESGLDPAAVSEEVFTGQDPDARVDSADRLITELGEEVYLNVLAQLGYNEALGDHETVPFNE